MAAQPTNGHEHNHGKDHDQQHADHLVFALAGNPNSGKTTVFNHYTGSRQHVGNYPGITVEKKEGIAKLDGNPIKIIDLPGTYSLTAYSPEEVVARQVITTEKPDLVINVLNANALERNLYLTVQLLELGCPLALSLNMIDEVRAQGTTIDIPKLSSLLHVPVVGTTARKGEGLLELLTEANKAAREHKGKPTTSLTISYGPDLDPIIHIMAERIEQEKFLTNQYPARWIALKYLENDAEIIKQGRAENNSNLSSWLDVQTHEITTHLEKTLNTYPEAIIADYRYGFIASLLKQGVINRLDNLKTRIAASDKIDTVLTHKFFGPLFMLTILYVVYFFTFNLGEVPQGWVETAFEKLGELAAGVLPDGLLKSLVVSGIIAGVGGVLSFVPLIIIMFLFISMLEDSGYMARVSYMLDRVFRFFGLHGCSVMPFIISGGLGGGCAVPGIMATRTLRSPKEKLATILTAPYLACGAKIPVFILICSIFFKGKEATALLGITLFGWFTVLMVAWLLRSTVIRGEATPFVMELPPYRFPTFSGILIHTWERTWQYIKKAGTIILAVSILVWAAMTFPQLSEDAKAPFETVISQAEEGFDALGGDEAWEKAKEELQEAAKATGASEEDIEAIEPEDGALAEAKAVVTAAENALSEASLRNSVAGRIGTGMESVSKLAGFDWRTNIALVGGFAAKEVIVSTLGTAYSLGEVDPEDAPSLVESITNDPLWTLPMAMAFMVFVLLYAPCFVAVTVIKQESGSWKWALFSVVFNTLLAFGIAVLIYQIGMRLLA